MDSGNKGRLFSLDALRGFDMLLIIGLGAVEGSILRPGLVGNLCVWLGFGPDCWLAQQMLHVRWEGLHLMDTVFALFIFIAGASFPFSCAKRRARGDGDGAIALSALRRGLVLFGLGLVYGGFLLKGDLAHFRLYSVLGRIGFAWMFAAWLYLLFRTRTRLAIAAGILVAYWVTLRLVVAPDFPDASWHSAEGCIACWLDRTFLGNHLLAKGGARPLFDPAGFPSLPPAVVTAMLGMFAGDLVRRTDWSGARKVAGLAAAAVGCTGAGLFVAYGCGSWSFPIIKAIWSTSFTLVVGGYSFAMLALFYWLADVRMWRGWTYFLRVIGMNSITIYLAIQLVGFWRLNEYLFGGLAAQVSPDAGAVVLSLGHLVIVWTFLWFLHRNRLYLKI